MRLCALLFSPLVSAALGGVPPPFSAPSIDLGPLGLIDGAKKPALPPAGDLLSPRRLATETSHPKVSAPMPIVVPKEVDRRMIVTPPSDVDYKLRIQVPDVDMAEGRTRPSR